MGVSGLPAPTAEGSLANRPFAHLLLYVHQRGLSGTLAVWPEQRPGAELPAGQDRILLQGGTIVAARLLSPASALDRSLLPLFGRVNAPYAFYEADLVGSGDGVLVAEIDPIGLVTASLRGSAREDAVEGVLSRFGDGPVRLTPRVPLDRYGFDDKEKGFVELLRASPDSVRGLCAAWSDERMARRILYLLAITKGIEPWSGQRAGTSAADAGAGEVEAHANERSQGAPPPSEAPQRTVTSPVTSQPPRRSGSEDDDWFAEVPPETAGPPAATVARPSSIPPASVRPRSMRPTSIAPNAGGSSAPPPRRKRHQPEPPPDPPAGLAPQHAQLWKEIGERARSLEQMNYYDMLGVARDASASTIRDAYFALAKKWHPDRLPRELEPLRPWVDSIFHHATQARDTLSDEQQRSQYLKTVQSGGGTPEADRELNAIVTAAMAVQKVEVLVRKREWVESLHILREALELNPEDSDAHAMEGWVLMQMAGAQAPWDSVHAALDRALQLNQRSAKAHFFKAMALKRQNKHQSALSHFRTCAELDPKNIEAAREVRLAEMRKGKPTPDGLLSKLFKKK